MLLHILGQRIRKQRKKRLLTQSDLAQKSGVSLRFVAQLESGKGNVSNSFCALYCVFNDLQILFYAL